MKITVKLFALLGSYLPAGAKDNQIDIDVVDGAAIQTVLDDMGVPPEHCHLVLVNGVYIAPSERPTHTLVAGDALAVWPPVAGG